MAVRILIMLALLALLAAPAAAQQLNTPASSDAYWRTGRAALAERLRIIHRPQRAKNVILLIGDGMGVSTVTAARIFDAQYPDNGAPKRSGEENTLSFETLPHVALVKTYNTDAQVGDSAGTATAMNTGIKTRIGYLNFAPEQTEADCNAPAKWPRTLAEIAKDQGMAVGIVSTARLTHATPAAVYAHVPNRNWESDAKNSGCKDIAAQMIDFKPGLDIMLGGGSARFLPKESGGFRSDGRDLIKTWQARTPSAKYINSISGLKSLSNKGSEPVLGLFTPDHMSYETDRDPSKEPSLTDMTRFALERLPHQSKKGYYLMIEGGRIDHAHHASNPYRALSEAQQFHRAVELVLKTVNLDETLVLVTADHSHTLTMAGYSVRGNDILGYVRSAPGGESRGSQSPEGFALDDRGQPMTTLSYTNGAFISPPLSRRLPPNDPNYLSSKTYGTDSETHGGEDVALYATGPRAHLVGGVIEQNVIFHLIAEALGWR